MKLTRPQPEPSSAFVTRGSSTELNGDGVRLAASEAVRLGPCVLGRVVERPTSQQWERSRPDHRRGRGACGIMFASPPQGLSSAAAVKTRVSYAVVEPNDERRGRTIKRQTKPQRPHNRLHPTGRRLRAEPLRPDRCRKARVPALRSPGVCVLSPPNRLYAGRTTRAPRPSSPWP